MRGVIFQFCLIVYALKVEIDAQGGDETVFDDDESIFDDDESVFSEDLSVFDDDFQDIRLKDLSVSDDDFPDIRLPPDDESVFDCTPSSGAPKPCMLRTSRSDGKNISIIQ